MTTPNKEGKRKDMSARDRDPPSVDQTSSGSETTARDERPAIPTTCIEHAYGSTFRLSFQIKVF